MADVAFTIKVLFALILNLLIWVDCLAETLHSLENIMTEKRRKKLVKLALWLGATLNEVSEYEHRHVFGPWGGFVGVEIHIDLVEHLVDELLLPFII